MGADLLAADGGGAVAIGVTVVATLVVVALLAVVFQLVRAARAMRLAADELARNSALLLRDLRATVTDATAELDRVDGLIGTAEAITETVGSASRLTYAALSNPVIKVLAFGSGTARATRRLRHARADHKGN
jgi:hypothetical protein